MSTKQLLQQCLGERDTHKLMCFFGGMSIYIPKKIKSTHRLHITLGTNANQLSQHFSGLYLNVPKRKSMKVDVGIRNQLLVMDFNSRQGKLNELAKKYDLSSRHVRRIVKQSNERAEAVV